MAEKIIDWFMKYVLSWLIILALFLGIILTIVLIANFYNAVTSETFSLNKKEWHCTGIIQNTTYVKSGNILLPVHSNTCTEYKRIY